MTTRRTPLKEITKEQERLARSVVIRPFAGLPENVGAGDAAYIREFNLTVAAAVVVRRENFEVLDSSIVMEKTGFPYIPGYLSMREVPPLLKAFKGLKEGFGAALIDGQGIAHPRGLGLASHLGVLLDIPTIGCAKKRLTGESGPLGRKKGSFRHLRYGGEKIGVVLRTRDNVKPVFVSPGHLMDVESALRIVISCLGRFRVPEPLRIAHRLASEHKRRLEDSP